MRKTSGYFAVRSHKTVVCIHGKLNRDADGAYREGPRTYALASYEVELDRDKLTAMISRAANSNGRKSQDGPVRVKITNLVEVKQ